MNEKIREKLMNIFKENGYLVDAENECVQLELDSLQFISILCDIENDFDISIPDEYLSGNGLNTFWDFLEVVRNIVEEEARDD